jgi:hypothetical protein
MPRFQLSLNGHTFTTDDLQTAQSFLLSPEACIQRNDIAWQQ